MLGSALAAKSKYIAAKADPTINAVLNANKNDTLILIWFQFCGHKPSAQLFLKSSCAATKLPRAR
jgi:hypothetical protein